MMRMRKEILLAVCSALFLNAGANAQYNGSSAYMDLYDSETASSLKSHVRELSSAMMEGRKAGSEGERLAADYVSEQLKSYGVDVLSPDGGDVFRSPGLKQGTR